MAGGAVACGVVWRMRNRFLPLALLLLLVLSTRAALADDEQDIRALLGRDVATFLVSGNWAVADVGNIQKATIEVVLLHRYKGEWRRVGTPGGLSRAELLALGVPDEAAADFGLGQVPDKVISSLSSAMSSAGLHHKSFNVITYGGTFLGYTSNGPRSDGYQVWAYMGSWKPLFRVEPKTSQADADKTFDSHHIPLFTEYRLLIGRGTPQ